MAGGPSKGEAAKIAETLARGADDAKHDGRNDEKTLDLPAIGAFIFAMHSYMRGDDMNATTETKKADEISLTESAIGLLRYYFGGAEA